MSIVTMNLNALSPPPSEQTESPGMIRAGLSVSDEAFAQIRSAMALEHCKWDPQVEDIATIAPFPLLIEFSEWEQLASAAETLCSETMELEQAVLDQPALLRQLGLPAPLRRLFCSRDTPTPAACRVMRFDFHPTHHGWRVSEVNSDVPGGFAESSALPTLMNEHFRNARPVGNPAARFTSALVKACAKQKSDLVVLLSAPGFMEDQQVVSCLARNFRTVGLRAEMAQQHHLRWIDGTAHLDCHWSSGRIGAIVRFYQGEWLAHLPRHHRGWRNLLFGGLTPVANPGLAILSESKRLPVVWDRTGLALPAWRRYLPTTCRATQAHLSRNSASILKTAYCNTGDDVIRPETMTLSKRLKIRRDIVLDSHHWIAQDRFDIAPISTPWGVMYPCVGVYTIDGSACGAYARLCREPVIDYRAIDAAMLVVGGREENP